MFQVCRNKLYQSSMLYLFKHTKRKEGSAFYNQVWHNVYTHKYSTVGPLNVQKYHFMNQYLAQNAPYTEWEKLRVKYIENERGVDERNVDALIIHYLTMKHYWGHGKDFVRYMNDKGTKLNIGAIGKLFKFYHCFGLENKLANEEKDHIINVYDDVCSKFKVLDSVTGENCIAALSLTKKWKEGLNIIEKMNVITIPSRLAFSCIASAAFANSSPEIGWEFLQKMSDCHRQPYDYVFSAYIDYCTSTYKNDTKSLLLNLEKMFYYCGENNINIGISIVHRLTEVFSSNFQWKGDIVRLNKSGLCHNCKTSLNSISVTNEEFAELRAAFYRKVLVGRSIFIKSSPKEQKAFMELLEKKAPFDVVIDGLNVAYSIPRRVQSGLLVSVVKKFVSENKKIFVLGRKHMAQWPKDDMDYIKSNALLFLTDDLSYDDPFLLLAALSSPHTKFFSRDFMRGHRFLLQDERLRTIFKRWQQMNQLSLTYVTASKVIIKDPLKYLPLAQKNIGWHIPCNLQDDLINPDSIDLPENWLCLHPKKKSSYY